MKKIALIAFLATRLRLPLTRAIPQAAMFLAAARR